MRIVLTGGGTGGHIVPFAPIIEALRTLHIEQKSKLPKYLEPETLEIMFAGVLTNDARVLFNQYDVKTYNIPSGKVRRYFSPRTLSDLLFRLPIGILVSLWRMWSLMPDVVISKGGYGSLPVVLACALYRIPVLLHESDAVIGKSNQSLIRFSAGIALGYGAAIESLGVHKRKAVVTGNPIRNAIRSTTSNDGKKAFGISPEEFVLLVVGGSQGAKQLNEALLASLPQLIVDMTIIHVTGPDHFETIQTVATELLAHSPRKSQYMVSPYLSDRMIYALAAADAVVTRAGTSLSEIAAARKPSLIIPLDSAASDHQRKNAQTFEAAGAAIVLDPTNVGKNIFEQNVRRLKDDSQLRGILQQNLAQLDFPNAARDIAALALSLAQGLQPRSNTSK